MRTMFLSLLAALVVLGAADDWAKVKELKTGSDLRIYKRGAAQPIEAQMGDLTDDNLIILVKKTESAIPRDQIERIDARPSGRPKATKETTTKDGVDPDGSRSTGTSTSYGFGSKPDYETVYRRPVAQPKK